MPGANTTYNQGFFPELYLCAPEFCTPKTIVLYYAYGENKAIASENK